MNKRKKEGKKPAKGISETAEVISKAVADKTEAAKELTKEAVKTAAETTGAAKELTKEIAKTAAETTGAAKELTKEIVKTAAETTGAAKELTKEAVKTAAETTEAAKELAKEITKEVKIAARRKARAAAGKWHRMIGVAHMCIGAILFGLLAGWLSYSGVLETADRMVSDLIYQSIARKQSNARIRIISIDEKTVKKYGEYEDWSREHTAELIKRLNQDEEYAPGVIGIALDYSEEKEIASDLALVETCSKYKNICFGVSAEEVEPLEHLKQQQFSFQKRKDQEKESDNQISVVERPFDSLLEQVTIGIVNNTRNSKDGIVRNAFSSVQVGGFEIDSFATAIYKMYRDFLGKEYKLPKLDEDNYFQFTFSKTSQEYMVYSFCDVAEGKIAPAAFEDGIVLVGSYIDDSTFRAPNQRGTQMHELELQANLLEALLEQRTGQQASPFFTAVFSGFFMALFFIATSYSSIILTFVIAFGVITAQFFACWIVNLLGYYVNILVPIIMVALISSYNLILRYTIAIQNQYAIEKVFKKYVDESVVSELGKDGRIKAKIGVVRKDVAVLFVDIRGFTSLSECLQPEQIVDILNAYLELVAQAVAKHQGTLDKFIGDAAMAVFNSPNNLVDYEYKAVCAALDLRSNAAALNEKCEREYGKQVSFGIGIQCGEAVIGNIGCDRRMDYTAIGDTVNTASRLEGAAAPGQILVSEELAKRLKGRIQTRFAGEYMLKGKKSAVLTYTVEGLAQAE